MRKQRFGEVCNWLKITGLLSAEPQSELVTLGHKVSVKEK